MAASPIDRADLLRGRASDVLTRATELSYVVLESPDLEQARRFYEDFGLVVSARTERALYFRAAGASHHVLKVVAGSRGRLVSLGLGVESELDLRRLASLPDAQVEDVDEPGGGRRVRLLAPGGIVVEAVHGLAALAPRPTRSPEPANAPGELARIGKPVRFSPGPSEVLRIGHIAVETPQPEALILWLMRTFGMIVSDYQPLDEQDGALPIAAFVRCDRGATPTDHHTVAVALGPTAGVAHVAFEVRDVDEVGRGAAFLRSKNHRHSWGIGRHILGSQVFDYWRAPDGVMVEHFCDGDVFEASAPTGRLLFCGSNLASWGGRPPLDFALPPLSVEGVAAVVRGIATSDEAPVSLFVRALRALSR